MLIRERGLASRMVPIEVIKITTIINNIIVKNADHGWGLSGGGFLIEVIKSFCS